MKRMSGKLSRFLVVLGASCLLLAGTVWSLDDRDDNQKTSIQKRIDESANVLKEIMETPDKAIPDKVLKDAKCIAVIPSMVKIAIGFGGNHGKGVAICRLPNGSWSAPAPITITGGSWGLQLGGQAIDLVLVVMNDRGMAKLLQSPVSPPDLAMRKARFRSFLWSLAGLSPAVATPSPFQ